MVTSQNRASRQKVRIHHQSTINSWQDRGDSQNSRCEQHRTQLTMFWSEVSGRNTTQILGMFYNLRRRYFTVIRAPPLRSVTVFMVAVTTFLAPVNVPGWVLWRTATARLNLHYGRTIRPWSAEYGCHSLCTSCWPFLEGLLIHIQVRPLKFTL